MRESHVVSHSAGCVVLRPSILRQLHIRENGVLYGTLLRDHTGNTVGEGCEEHSVVLSPIPSDVWNNCYRLIINTSAQHRSLARICRSLRNNGLRLIQVSAIGASVHGDLTATMIVTEQEPSPLSEAIGERLNKARREIQDSDVLSQSSLFGTHSKLDTFVSTKLKCLAGFAPTKPNQRLTCLGDPVTIKLRNSVVDLSSIKYGSSQVFNWLMAEPSTSTYGSKAALVMTDSEEWFLRLWLIPPEPIRRFEFDYTVHGRGAQHLDTTTSSSSLHNYFVEIIDAFSSPPLSLNIYHADHHTLDRNADTRSERSRIVIIGDTLLSVGRDNNEHLRTAGRKQVGEALRARSDDLGETAELDEESLTLSPLHMLQAPVFVATNAKCGMRLEYLSMAMDLVRQLKVRRLYPVNVEISNSPDLMEEIRGVLSACPMFIALHLPEEINRYAHKRTDGVRYAPSAWVQFEEALAIAEPERRSYRLRHREVATPQFDFRKKVEDKFKDDEFGAALASLMDRIDAELHKHEWRAKVDHFSRAK